MATCTSSPSGLPMMPSARSSSAKPRPARPGRASTAADARRTPDPILPQPDQDALDALDFAARGRSEAEIGYGEDAPKLSEEQLAQFKPASFRIGRRAPK